jgi:putative tryptophan/tyrosine transport system substrate-binding protein
MSFAGLKRREFVTLVGGAAVAWPLGAHAQQSAKLPTIGFMGSDASAWRTWTDAFVGRLYELGWVEGRTIAIEYRWTEGRPERLAEIAAEFIRLKVEVIVTYGGAVAAFKQATASIPIVFAIAVDPVGIGLVPSLARPGGNSTRKKFARQCARVVREWKSLLSPPCLISWNFLILQVNRVNQFTNEILIPGFA